MYPIESKVLTVDSLNLSLP